MPGKAFFAIVLYMKCIYTRCEGFRGFWGNALMHGYSEEEWTEEEWEESDTEEEW